MGGITNPPGYNNGTGIYNNIDQNASTTANSVPFFSASGPAYPLTVSKTPGTSGFFFSDGATTKTLFSRYADGTNTATQTITGDQTYSQMSVQFGATNANTITVTSANNANTISAGASNAATADLNFQTTATSGTPSTADFNFSSTQNNGGKLTFTQNWSSTGTLHASTVNVAADAGPANAASTLARWQKISVTKASISLDGVVTAASFTPTTTATNGLGLAGANNPAIYVSAGTKIQDWTIAGTTITGRVTTSSQITQQGSISVGASNATILANSSGQAQFWSLGVDTATRGSWTMVIARSDLSNSVEVLKCDTSGNLTAAGSLTLPGGTLLLTSGNLTDGSGASVGTLTNAPSAGNPTKWVPVNDNGTTRYIPMW